MKSTLFITLFVFFAGGLLGQLETNIIPPFPRNIDNYDVVDTGYISIWYVLNPGENLEENEDVQILEIGKNISKYYSYYVYRSDSIALDYAKKRPNSKSSSMGSTPSNSRPYWSESFIEPSKDLFTEYVRTAHDLNNYWYSEKMPVQDWNILNDTLSIAGYLCQKAECKFRGRNYIAWFATDIPINKGPWKFSGLPGLIMKIHDTDDKFIFECIAIKNTQVPIKKYDYNEYSKNSRKNILKLQNNINEDYFRTVGYTETASFAKKHTKSPYNTFLLELE